LKIALKDLVEGNVHEEKYKLMGDYYYDKFTEKEKRYR
jgi:hypothetical protein